MKTTILTLTLLALAAACSSCSFGRGKYHTVTIVMDSACNAEQQSVAYGVINKRIASLWDVKEKTELINGRFDITYPGNDSLLSQLLAQRGEIYISETYQNDEMEPTVLSIYTAILTAEDNPDEESRWVPYGDSRSVPVLICAPQHAAFTDSVLNSWRHLFPADASFCWTAKPKKDVNGEEFLELLILKTASRNFPLNPGTVKTSDYYNDRYGYEAVAIELTVPYAEEWARLTRNNIGRSLAFVIDGKALMYPTVQSEITGGKLQITGNLDYDELLLIKSFLSGGVLDCRAHLETIR